MLILGLGSGAEEMNQLGMGVIIFQANDMAVFRQIRYALMMTSVSQATAMSVAIATLTFFGKPRMASATEPVKMVSAPCGRGCGLPDREHLQSLRRFEVLYGGRHGPHKGKGSHRSNRQWPRWQYRSCGQIARRFFVTTHTEPCPPKRPPIPRSNNAGFKIASRIQRRQGPRRSPPHSQAGLKAGSEKSL